MNQIASHIEYLLQWNDCVVVPRFGAFVLQRIEAHYDNERRKFIPPTASVVFNPDVNHNDGLLVTSVSRAMSVSYENALKDVEEQVASIKAQLQEDGHLDFGTIGAFSSKGKHIVFTPDRTNQILHSYASLSSLDNISTVEMRINDDINLSTDSSSKATVLNLNHIIRVAASIIIVVLIGLICSTPSIISETEFTYASVYPADLTDNNEDQPGSIIIQPDIELYIADVVETSEEQLDKEPDIQNVRFEDTDHYILVVGSFDTYSQAQKFIKSKSSFKMSVVENDGRFRVYAATGKTMNDAASALKNEAFTSVFPSGWPCRK